MYTSTKLHVDKLDVSKILTNVIINVGLIATFIGVFYFTYVVTVEEEFVINQLNILSTNIIYSIKPFLSEDNKKYIIKNIKKPNLAAQDEDIVQKNNKLTSSAIMNIGIIFVVTMITGYILCKYYNHNYKDIMINNLILLSMVGLTEYTFLHMIPAKYITTDPNFVNYKVASNLKRKITIVP